MKIDHSLVPRNLFRTVPNPFTFCTSSIKRYFVPFIAETDSIN